MSTINDLYQNVAGKQREEYRDYMMKIDRMDWHSYDYTTWPAADLSFPDYDEDTALDLWPFKPNLNKPHWVDLNSQFLKGIERYGYANRLELPEQITSIPHSLASEKMNEIKGLKDSDTSEFQNQLAAYGFSDEKHLLWTISRFNAADEKALDEGDRILREQKEILDAQMEANIEAAASGGLLDPIEGIDMETWAAANVKIANGMDLEEVLKIVGTEKPIWDKVSAEWMARMSQDTTFAISKVYGDAFLNPNIGKFAEAISETPTETTSSNSESGLNAVMNDFELYIKVMCHQNMASTQGIDASSILGEYGLSITDWSSAGMHWSTKMATDTRMALKMNELMTKYNAEFATAKAGDDIDF